MHNDGQKTGRQLFIPHNGQPNRKTEEYEKESPLLYIRIDVSVRQKLLLSLFQSIVRNKLHIKCLFKDKFKIFRLGWQPNFIVTTPLRRSIAEGGLLPAQKS